MKRWRIWSYIIAICGLLLMVYLNNSPRVRTVMVGSQFIEVTVKGYRDAQTVVEYGPTGMIEYGVNGDKVTTVKSVLADGSIIFHVYRYDSEGWSRLITEHRPGGWPGSIRRYREDSGSLPEGAGG